MVFHFPEGDTVALKIPTQSYYQLTRMYGRERVWSDKRNFGEIIARPVDKRENYIKRCVAIPGDEIKTGKRTTFCKWRTTAGNSQECNTIILFRTNGTSLNPKALERLNIADDDRQGYSSEQYVLPLTDENETKIKDFANVISVEEIMEEPGKWDANIFPSHENYPWNVDNFGPITIPAKGATVQLTIDNLPLYKRIIDVYENNKLEVNGEEIKINDEVATSYTFKMDYYWMMGDNRHNSADSRYWGFVPEDHVVGKAKFIWLSMDKDKSFPAKIRFKRMFSVIR